jgi:hypothetical protein
MAGIALSDLGDLHSRREDGNDPVRVSKLRQNRSMLLRLERSQWPYRPRPVICLV